MTLLYSAALVYVLLLPGNNLLVRDLAALVKDAGFTVGHALGFGLLALLWQWSLGGQMSTRRAALLALGGAMVVGISTEYGQTMVAGRGADGKDFIADLLGASLALYMAYRYEIF